MPELLSAHKRVVLLALLVLLTALMAACGGDGGSDAASSERTRTIRDATGETVTVPQRPTRVLALSEPTLDAALALGVRPVGATSGRGQSAVPAYLRDRMKGVPSVGTLGAPSLEKVYNLHPDIILLDGTAFQDPAVVDKLRKIAPVVSVSRDSLDWKASVRRTADALGRSAEAVKLMADYDREVAEVKKAIAAAGNAGKTASIVRWGGIGLPAVLMKEVCAGRVLTDLGVPRPASQDKMGPGHSVPISLESIESLDADWMYFGALGGGSVGEVSDKPADVASARQAIKWASETPGFDKLGAVRAGHVVPVDGSAWTSAGGPLAARVVLEDVKRTLGA